jgi:SAM-dependent methyltransferase
VTWRPSPAALRRRFFAWLFARGEEVNRRVTGAVREELVGDLVGDVLEVGCGTGTNFGFYHPATVRVTATDPNPHMLRRAAAAAAAAGADIRLEIAEAGALPFEAASFDAVVASLVLCSVPDLPATLAELQRVLRPGGTLRLFEHVRSRRRWIGRLQTLANPVWGVMADGCHLDRDTGAAVRDAGFTVEVEEPLGLRLRALPLRAILVRARR